MQENINIPDSTITTNLSFRQLVLMNMQQLTNFPYIEKDFDALTDYELLCLVVKFLNDVIANQNEQNASITRMYESFLALQTYVNNTKDTLEDAFNNLDGYVRNYFDNLDVQEEINNKLDQMLEDGVLEQIIEQFIQSSALWCFDNVESMKQATNLINGSYARTLGYYEVNDGGEATYKITDTESQTEYQEELENGLYATLIIDNVVNVKQFGAYGDGINDDTIPIQNAINNCNNIYIPYTTDYYLITDTININKNNLIIKGNYSHLQQPDNLEKNIFNIYNSNNITLDNLYLSNESTQESSSPLLNNKRLVYINNSSNITIKNCKFKKAYCRGIEILKSSDINYINNIFENATFQMLYLLPEVRDVLVDNSIFDTIDGNYNLNYLFATGRVDTETYDYSVKNIIIKNSKFLNNPTWEAIDTHSANGFIVENNYIENCRVGIMALAGSTKPVTTDPVKLANVTIKNNYMKCSKNGEGRYGIIIGCNDNLGENVTIENNKIVEFGDRETRGAIQIEGLKNFNIKDNMILKSEGTGICLSYCYNGNIDSNQIIDTHNETRDDYGIFAIAGAWDINITNNTIKNLNTPKLINGIRSSLLSNFNLNNNNVIANNRYRILGTVTSGEINQYTDQIGRAGNYAYNNYQIPTYYCTDENVHPATSGNISNVSVTGTSGTNELTSNNAIYYLAPNEEITISGAGESGADLTTVITDFITKHKFKVKDNISTSVENATVSATAGTWVAIS